MNKRYPAVIRDGDKAPGQEEVPKNRGDHPPAEDEFGGGDICSVEEEAPTDDDKPLP